MAALTANDIQVGRVYRAKRPKKVAGDVVNDRHVLWVSTDQLRVQYDGPSVAWGRHYPTVSMAVFLAWVDREVTPDD